MKLYVFEPDCPSSDDQTDTGAIDDQPLNNVVIAEQLMRFYAFLHSAMHSGLSNIGSDVENWDGPELQVVHIPAIGLSFGMLAEVHSLISRLLAMDDVEPAALVEFSDDVLSLLSSTTVRDDSRDPRLFLDGTFFQADWLEDIEAGNDGST